MVVTVAVDRVTQKKNSSIAVWLLTRRLFAHTIHALQLHPHLLRFRHCLNLSIQSDDIGIDAAVCHAPLGCLLFPHFGLSMIVSLLVTICLQSRICLLRIVALRPQSV
jgi:hypothetical protein